MENTDTVIAVFADHPAAEAAIKKLTGAGFDMKNLSVVGKGYHTDEKVVAHLGTKAARLRREGGGRGDRCQSKRPCRSRRRPGLARISHAI